MQDTLKAMARTEESLRKCAAQLARAEDRYAHAQTACNALLVMYARDDVAIRTVVHRAAVAAHRDAMVGDYASFASVSNSAAGTMRMSGIA